MAWSAVNGFQMAAPEIPDAVAPGGGPVRLRLALLLSFLPSFLSINVPRARALSLLSLVPPMSASLKVGYVHVPFSLLPNAVPRSEFDRAVDLAPLFNLLVDAVACDQVGSLLAASRLTRACVSLCAGPVTPVAMVLG